MIQSYLKTGMVFYDDINKQHFRDSCCKETFCQFTDNEHFPSYQFIVDGYRPFLGFGNWRIFDLDDNDLGAWVANTPTPTIYHLGDDIYQFTFDFRNAIIYPGLVDYETCYYLRLTINPTGVEQYFYSEAFRVCDCEVEGVGDGLNLIENGWMVDWFGVADPNNYPLEWTLINNNATNYVADAGGECQMISDNTQVVQIYQTILELGKWYVYDIEVTGWTAGAIRLWGTGIIATITATGHYNGVFLADSANFIIAQLGVCNITFTDVRIQEFVGFEFCDMMTLNWWSDCDWDSIIYQDGFRNSLVLGDSQGAIALDTPKEDIVINPDERQGEMFVHDVVIKKRYKFNIRIPEYLWNALIRLPAYGSEMPNFHCWITLPDGSACPMSEVAILGEWDVGNCMNTLTIEFVDDDEYPVVAGNCCENEDVSEV